MEFSGLKITLERQNPTWYKYKITIIVKLIDVPFVIFFFKKLKNTMKYTTAITEFSGIHMHNQKEIRLF